jgi:CubicO group peptidase (beta-lactamase class C family)
VGVRNAVRLFSLYVLALLISFSANSFGLAQSPPNFEEFERTILAELRETKTPGAAIVVIEDNRVVFAKGFGAANVETNAPVTTETLFHIGSLTKMMTAAVVVGLADEGKVDLNAPIGTYLKNLNPKIARLTLHRLLSQTSGLRDITGDSGSQDEKALAEFAQSLTEKDLIFEAGKYFSYSNAGYALAGAVLEKVSQKSYADEMNERVFAPLAMNRTTFRASLAMTYPLAVGHTIDKEGKAQVARPFAVNTSLAPAGYAYSNIKDFTDFVLAILDDGKFKDKTVFSAKTVSQLLTAHVEIPTNVFTGGKYGYGWFLQDFRGYRAAEHGGTQLGFASEVKIVPEGNFAVIIFANRDGVRLNKTIGKAFDLFLPIRNTIEKKSAPSLPMTTEEMQSYVGTYANRWSMDIFLRDGKLFLRRFGIELPVTKIGKNLFSVTPAPNAPEQEFTIDSDSSGKAEALRMFLWAFKKQ